ncbi:RIC1-domain-containing protein [Boletus reticuloceps]|uniref:RIC1-domain-containing protein n=1 Tax=Boletus reticuloceps TaxID=495285 RepID=A0A8I2YZ54_9AGAM|nr:RIC1-domain-containing protein [Boletus reticuloceps]
MKFFSQSFVYDDPWSIVSLAFFLRYPNPYASHVVSCDVVDRRQTDSGSLLTTRLILKRGTLPRWAPQGIISRTESWIIEESEVDPFGKVVRCRTKNLDHVKVMQIEETQLFQQSQDGRTIQTTHAYITSRLGWGLTKSIESHGLARFKAHVQRSRQGVSLMMDFIRQARLQPMAFGSYISTIHSDMSFVVPETSVPSSSGNNTGHKPENNHVPTSQNNKWFNRVWGVAPIKPPPGFRSTDLVGCTFRQSAARQLSSVPTLPDVPLESILSLEPSPRKSLFCALSRHAITVWRVRPSTPLAYLARSETSLKEHGDNLAVTWSPDGSRIVIQTTLSHLVLVMVDCIPDVAVYQPPDFPPGVQRNFLAGPGEGLSLQSLTLSFEGVIRAEGQVLSVSPRKHHLAFSTSAPPAIQRIPWPSYDDADAENDRSRKSLFGYDTWILNDHELPWLVDSDVTVKKILYSISGVETWITSDGRAYFVRLEENSQTEETGKVPRWVQKSRHIDSDGSSTGASTYEEPRRAVEVAVNARFSLVAVGTYSGTIEFTAFPSPEGPAPTPQIIDVPDPYNRPLGQVSTMEWSSDGYVLAVGWEHGWAIFSIGGRCLASGFGVDDVVDNDRFQDAFMHGIRDLFWAPGNFELVVLAQSSPNKRDGQMFILPFAKSATTCQHSPDNTRYAFLQMDDRALVYRGADQPDMSVINPESDVWQHIKIPQSYLASNWPIRYSALSNDGRLVAVAGRRGLIHYSSTSGRWKLFSSVAQEQAFAVKGGLLWFHHVLIAAVEVSKSFQSRIDTFIFPGLGTKQLIVGLHCGQYVEPLLIIPTTDTIKLHLCGSITFSGIIAVPSAVRVLSWMIPNAQKELGDPVDDLAVATVLMMVGGQLVLLRPRKSGNQEVKYDMQIFADRIEFCWIHLRGIGALENSLWGYDGRGIRVWLNALAIESPSSLSEAPQSVKESVNIPLDFYPLSVLMDKGIIIGAEYESATRMNLPFVMFRHTTSSHLFLHHVLRHYLEFGQIREAVQLATNYQHLVYFAHGLEILLHTVVESEVEAEADESGTSNVASKTLPVVIEFLDHFDVALDVVVGCARKTEVTRWKPLFDIIGNPKSLFEVCLNSGRLKTAGSYLLVLHNLEQREENNKDAIRLLQSAIDAQEWQLCREILRFLHSIDDTGMALRHALTLTNMIESSDSGEDPSSTN